MILTCHGIKLSGSTSLWLWGVALGNVSWINCGILAQTLGGSSASTVPSGQGGQEGQGGGVVAGSGGVVDGGGGIVVGGSGGGIVVMFSQEQTSTSYKKKKILIKKYTDVLLLYIITISELIHFKKWDVLANTLICNFCNFAIFAGLTILEMPVSTAAPWCSSSWQINGPPTSLKLN